MIRNVTELCQTCASDMESAGSTLECSKVICWWWCWLRCCRWFLSCFLEFCRKADILQRPGSVVIVVQQPASICGLYPACPSPNTLLTTWETKRLQLWIGKRRFDNRLRTVTHDWWSTMKLYVVNHGLSQETNHFELWLVMANLHGEVPAAGAPWGSARILPQGPWRPWRPCLHPLPRREWIVNLIMVVYGCLIMFDWHFSARASGVIDNQSDNDWYWLVNEKHDECLSIPLSVCLSICRGVGSAWRISDDYIYLHNSAYLSVIYPLISSVHLSICLYACLPLRW